MPRAAGAAAKPGIEKLHHGGEHNRFVPVFRQEFVLPGLLFRIQIGMVLQHPLVAQNIAHGFGVLVDNRSIGNDIDNAFQPVCLGMVHSMAQAGQRFAAAGGHG